MILTPRPSTLASRILEEEGVLGEVTISSYNLQFIPLEEDVLSLEHDNAFKEIWMVRSFCVFLVETLTETKVRTETRRQSIIPPRHS